VPGDPGIGPTSPEMRNLSLRYGIEIEDPLDLTMMEIKKALTEDRLSEIVT
jgi:5-formaminoimidazole-4-carboxamide-1-(beta)-D-ribofuranosyl 5'-monophosphate synthetase